MGDLTLLIVFISGLIILGSSIIKGISGFGTALFALPILTMLFFTPLEVRPVVVSLNLILNVFILVKERKLTAHNLNSLKPLVLAGFFAAILTGFFLPRMDLTLFSILLGLLLVFTALNKLFNFKFNIHHHHRYFVPMGILGGALNTLIGAGGVPVLIFLSNTKIPKDEFRMDLLLFFFALNTGSILSFIMTDSYPITALILVLSFLPFAIIGSLIGMRIAGKVNDRIFTRIIAILLLVMGLNNLFQLF